MRELFITDLHGQYTKTISLLESVNWDMDEDLLIIGGDYFDRGPENAELAEWLLSIYKHPNVVMLRGNHDTPLLHLLMPRNEITSDELMTIKLMMSSNGLNETIEQLSGRNVHHNTIAEFGEIINERYPKLKSMLESTLYYYETDKGIYTHAALPIDYENTSANKWEETIWSNSYNWACDLPKWQDAEVRSHFTKPVFVGHYSLSNLKYSSMTMYPWVNKEAPVFINGVFLCDGALGWGGEGIIVENNFSQK